MLKQENLVEYKIYYYNYYDDVYIFKYKEKNNSYCHLYKNREQYKSEKGTWNGFADAKELREATPQEIKWLETCIKENRYISFENIKFNNELEIEIW